MKHSHDLTDSVMLTHPEHGVVEVFVNPLEDEVVALHHMSYTGSVICVPGERALDFINELSDSQRSN